MKKKLGIIQLELPEIELDDDFGDTSNTDISSYLIEEQKEIIRTLGGSKLVLVKCRIIDSSGNVLNTRQICSVGGTYNGLVIVNFDDSQKAVCVEIYEQSGSYYIYS